MFILSKRYLTDCIEDQWTKILKHAKDSIVFLDNSAAQCVHMHGGLKRFLESNAVSIESFSPFVKADWKIRNALFVLMTPLIEETWRTVTIIVRANSFKNCVVVSSFPAKCHDDTINSNLVFTTLESQLSNWVTNKSFTCMISHSPVFLAHVSQSLFLMPAFSQLFSISRCGLAEMNTKKSDDFSIKSFSSEMQSSIKHLAFSLISLLDTLQVKSDIFSLGTLSHMLSTELESISQQLKKSHSSKVSMVIVDRLLDLAGPLSQSHETMLDKILSALQPIPGHGFDVCIPMDDLTASKSESVFGRPLVAHGCIAHKSSPVEDATLNAILLKKPREVLIDVNRSVVECATKEDIRLDLNARLTHAVLRQRIARFKEKPVAMYKHSGLLQQALAVVQALEHSACHSTDNLAAIEKALLEYLAISPEEVLNNIMQMISEKEEMNYNMEDILIFLAFFYMLSAESDIANEAAMQATLMEECFQDKTKSELASLFIDEDEEDEFVLDSVRTLFDVFKRLGSTRKRMKKYSSLFKSTNPAFPAAYDSLLKQLLEDIFNPSIQDIPDLEFHSGGIKDYIKTGFSLFMNVAKPQPRDNPAIFLIVLGGATATEIKIVHDIAQKKGAEIILLCTEVLTPSRVLKEVGLIVKDIMKDNTVKGNFST